MEEVESSQEIPSRAYQQTRHQSRWRKLTNLSCDLIKSTRGRFNVPPVFSLLSSLLFSLLSALVRRWCSYWFVVAPALQQFNIRHAHGQAK